MRCVDGFVGSDVWIGGSGCRRLHLQPFERETDGVFDRSVGRLFQNGSSDSVGSDVWIGGSGCRMLRLQPFERDADGVFDRSVGRLFQDGGSDSVGSDVWVGEFGMPEAAFATVRARCGRCLRPQRRASLSGRRFGFRRQRCMGWGVRDAGGCIYNRLSARRTVSSTAASGVSFKTAVTAFSAALLGNPSMTSAAVASS